MKNALWLLNFVVLQWFGVRLVRALPRELCVTGLAPGDGPVRISGTGALPGGLRHDVDYYVPRGDRRWCIRWAWPLTGWRTL